ncbi:MAG: hypothetical protein N3D11_07755 [Candidatus Sumerlaeia bacterium]|nr:hypothetical protein [Candidatus Sumerlaeia bacterium]
MDPNPRGTFSNPIPSPARRAWLIVLLVIAAVLAAFYAFVTLRGPGDFAGELAALLPARTSGFVMLKDFEGIRSAIEKTRLYDELANSMDLAALLMTREDWRKYQENKDSLEWKAKAALAREFLRRYFSREVVLALSKLDRCDEPALLIMARTELGFAEKLAELCSQLYPELLLSHEVYRGIPLYAYDAPKSRRAFTYVRFGQTVVISLRSNERDYLRRIIDYRLDRPAETFFSTADFQRAWRSPARLQGLLGVARPLACFKDLRARPEFTLRDRLSRPLETSFQNILNVFRFIEGAATVGQGRIEFRFALRCEQAAMSFMPMSVADKPLALLDAVPTSAVAFVDLRFDRLDETLARFLNFDRALAGEAGNKEALDAAVARLNQQWGLDINGELAPAFGREAALVVHNVQLPMLFVASLLLPTADPPRAEAAMNKVAARQAESLAAQGAQIPASFRATPLFRPLHATPFGFLGTGWLAADPFGTLCHLGLGPESYLAMKEHFERRGEPITRNAVFRSLALPVGEPLDLAAFVNLEEVGRRAEGLLAVLSLTSQSVREQSAKYGKILAVLKLLRGAGMVMDHSADEVRLVVRVPTE